MFHFLRVQFFVTIMILKTLFEINIFLIFYYKKFPHHLDKYFFSVLLTRIKNIIISYISHVHLPQFSEHQTTPPPLFLSLWFFDLTFWHVSIYNVHTHLCFLYNTVYESKLLKKSRKNYVMCLNVYSLHVTTHMT